MLKELARQVDELEALVLRSDDLSQGVDLIAGVVGPISRVVQGDAGIGSQVAVGLTLENFKQPQASKVNMLHMLVEAADDGDALFERFFPGSPPTALQAIVKKRDVVIDLFVDRGEAGSFGGRGIRPRD